MVPAECIVYFNPLAFRTLCTSATSLATETLPVPTFPLQTNPKCQHIFIYLFRLVSTSEDSRGPSRNLRNKTQAFRGWSNRGNSFSGRKGGVGR